MYVDYNATAPLRPIVKKIVQEVMDLVGNPSSVHRFGRDVRAHIEKAREQVAAYFRAAPKNVIFTSGATEANNMVLKHHPGPVIVSAIEHDSVYGIRADAHVIKVDKNGVVDLGHLKALLKNCQERPLVAVMAANNETGVIQPLGEVFDLCEEYNAHIHVDAVQAIGKIVFDYSRASSIALSGHKIGALSGIGALIKASSYHPKALIQGGGQERSFRSGTENVLGIISLGAAIQDLRYDNWEKVEVLRNLFENKIEKASPDAVIFGKNASRLPNTCCIAMPHVKSELQMMLFDQKGIALSSGSACSSGKIKESRVLKAMCIDAALVNKAVRMSLGLSTTQKDIHTLFDAWADIYHRQSKPFKQKSLQESLCHVAM